MANSPEINSYEFTSLDQLQKILKDNGWSNDQLNRLFSSPEIKTPFQKITLTKENISELAKKLDAANTRYEQQNLLRQVTMGNLVTEIGATYTFASIPELKAAIEQKKISFPDDYLGQVASFREGFKGPRTLTKSEYDTLIIELQKIGGDSPQNNADRGNLIRAAFKDLSKLQVVETKEIDSDGLKKLKKSLEQEISSPVTVESLTKLLDKIDSEKDISSRNIMVSYLWSRLASAGYIMTLQTGTVSLQKAADQKNAELLESTMKAYMSSGKLSISELQRAILVGSGSFGEYLETQKVNIKNTTTEGYVTYLTASLNIDISKGSPEQKVQSINKSNATPDEKAFLISYVKGGYSGYALAPDAERQLELRTASKEFMMSPEYANTISKVDAVSGGGTKAERERMNAGGKKEELTIETFMDNPTRAITRYPWTSLALVAGSIWKFGFGKTIFGLLAAMIGIKAVNEIGGETGIGKDLKDGIRKGWDEMTGRAKDAGKSVSGAASTAAAAVGLPGAAPAAGPANAPALTPSQQKGVLAINSQKSTIESAITMRQKTDARINGTLQNYTDYIHSQDVQNLKLSSIIFITDNKISIFSEAKTNDFSNRPANLDPAILKRVMRAYLGIPDPTGTPNTPEWGKKEKEDFIKKNGIDENTWKDKTFSELITKIYT